MNFWERVNEILDYNDINKKTLASEAGFDPSNITKGIKNNNIPSAETAVRIAKCLGTSVEYLVIGEKNDKDDLSFSACASRTLNVQKCETLLKEIATLPKEKQENIIDLLEKILILVR